MTEPPTNRDQRDDSLMSRFEQGGLRRYRARDAVIVVIAVGVLLALLEGPSVRRQGEQMHGIGRSIVLAFGRPSADVSNGLELASATHDLTGFLSPDKNLSSGSGGFSGGAVSARTANQIPAVTPDAFNPASIGARAGPKRKLHTLLVTGDSMSMPLDADLAQRLVTKGVKVIRDPHIGTGISNSNIVDWGKLSISQVHQDHPDAVVIFIGANDGWPMAGPRGRQVQCCSAQWAAIYAQRVRIMANTYRQNGTARVYWITLPLPRERARQSISTVVNAAIDVGLQPWADQTRIIDTVPIFTPSGYRDAMKVNGTPTIVRQADGIHLNDAGSSLLAGVVQRAIARDFTF
jgi:lysophospholipase L1-like esterase